MKGAPMSASVRELAELVGGKILGAADTVIQAARSLQEAQPGDITFLEDEKHLRRLTACKASAAVVPVTVTSAGIPLIQVTDPLFAFIAIVRHLQGLKGNETTGVDPRASIHPTVQLGADASVHPFACIGEGTTVGARC